MCIRDRQRGLDRTGDVVVLFADHVRIELARGGVQRVHRRVCLLYTSDAADERSSVDLGGRRIIKKKKHSADACAQSHNEEHTHLASYMSLYDVQHHQCSI